MHAHDRTLLSRLGFADPDKKLPRHDLACEYLAQSDKAHEAFFPSGNKIRGDAWKCAPALEVPISKGDGQYKTTIGFFDLTLSYAERFWRCACDFRRKFSLHNWGEHGPSETDEAYEKSRSEWRLMHPRECPKRHACWSPLDLISLVEVKITPCSAGEILRQIQLYREYREEFARTGHGVIGPWIVVTDFPLSVPEKSTLEREKITHFVLGAKFNEWVEKHTGKDAAVSASLEV